MMTFLSETKKSLGWDADKARHMLGIIACGSLDQKWIKRTAEYYQLDNQTLAEAVKIFMQVRIYGGFEKRASTSGGVATVQYEVDYELDSDSGFGFYWYMRVVSGANYISARSDGYLLYDVAIEYYGRAAADKRRARLNIFGRDSNDNVIWQGVHIEGDDIELRSTGHFVGDQHFPIIQEQWSNTASVCFVLYH